MSYNFPTDITGRVITDIDHDDKEITLAFLDGSAVTYEVEGDCCSSSWIEHISIPLGALGATVLSNWDHSNEVEDATPEEQAKHECLSVYWSALKTTAGEIILEYRNSSNGYYGGWLDERRY